MRVGIDTTPLRLTRAGTARYLRGLLEHLDVDVRPLAFGSAGRAWVLARELLWYPFVLGGAGGLDVLHCPTYYGPLRSRAPLVVTVHDLSVFRHPGAFPPWTRTFVPRFVPHVLRAARQVIAVSEFTRDELVELLGVDERKIRVVPNAVEDVFTAEGPAAAGEYVLAVGTLEPRKNLPRIAAAVPGELRIVGTRGWGGVEPPPNVVWLGEVDDEELARQYRGARCLVYASLYEGFGLPVAEAMACGCPVVTSNVSALPEVAGDAALLVDPGSVEAIAAGIAALWTDPDRRRELAARGRARARCFTWERAAQETVAVYEAVLA